MNEELYLSVDGNWGSASGLITFNTNDIPIELYEQMVEDPEGTYSEIYDYMKKNVW